MPTLVKISDGAVSADGLFAQTDGLLFEIHPPQRRFKWKKQQIDQLWQDIRNAHQADRDSYFLGTLLLVRLNENGNVSVIDGQQRITTLSILLAVLRDSCMAYTDLQIRANNIQQLISRVDNDGRPVGSLVVKLQDQDNNAYAELVKEPRSTNVARPENNLLSQAVKRMKEHVEKHINVPEPQESLRELCEYVQTRVKFLPLEINSEGEGYLVFDTTNTRGLRPSPSEALKARLATIARKDVQLSSKLITQWNAVATRLENAGLPINVMDDYIHAIWCSMHGYTSKRALDGIASKLDEQNSLDEFVEELSSNCQSYLDVVAPTAASSLTEDLKDLSNLNVQSQSFLMMVRRYSPGEFEKAVDMVLSLQIRNVTVGPFQANRYQNEWPKWAMLVRKGRTFEAFEGIRDAMVPDENFRTYFETDVVASPAIARHLLRRLDPISRRGSGVQPIEVDVEHVLPKSVFAKLAQGKPLTRNVRQWIEDLGYARPQTIEESRTLGQELERYTHKLGNQALLNDKENRGARDLPFSKKKGFYKRQALELTSSLSKKNNWGLGQITERQKQLARRATQIWRKADPGNSRSE